MSHLTDLITPRLPEGLSIPEPLDRAWAWMEAQGWGREGAHGGYFLTPYAGERQMGVVFSDDGSLEGWFDEDTPGFDRLFPIAETAGDGSFVALWLGDDGEVRFGNFGMLGRVLVAENAIDFLRLVAVGYDEWTFLGGEPEEESAEAHAAFRDWVTAEFGVQVPDAWEVPAPNTFAPWVDTMLGS